MPLPNEVFVVAVFVIGFPFFCGVVRTSKLPGYWYFVGAYFFLLLSNVFTVLEDFVWGNLFNILEHGCLTLSSFALLLAVYRLSRFSPRRYNPAKTDIEGEGQ